MADGDPPPPSKHIETAGRGILTDTHSVRTVLALGEDIRLDLNPAQLKAIKIAELTFAREVANKAAAAYQAILDAIL